MAEWMVEPRCVRRYGVRAGDAVSSLGTAPGHPFGLPSRKWKERASGERGRLHMDQSSDLLSMGRLQAGDRSALADLYDRHSPVMYGVALRILQNRTEAEDVLQESWMQAWKQRGSFDPARGNVPAWLVTIARTRALDRRRRQASRNRAETQTQVDPVSPAPTPDETTAHGKLKDRLVQALAALEPKQRQVLEIAYFEGLSQSEIAARLGAPLGSVKFWARQGLLQLRELVPRDEW